MGWFSSAPDPAASSLRPTPFDPGSTRVSTGTRIVGRIEGEMEVVIDGELEGEVRLVGHLLIGASWAVRGEVVARGVRVAGRVIGDVRGLERIELLAGGSVEGNLTAPRVVVAEGAFLSGRVVMHDTPADRAAAPEASATNEKSGEASAPAEASTPDAAAAVPTADGAASRQSSKDRGGKERPGKGPNAPTDAPR